MVLYGALLSLILFFFFFYPGLKNRGSYVYFDVQPGKASVVVEGNFAGTTPGPVFIRHGQRLVEIRKAYYSTQFLNIEIKGRIFATLFFPSRQMVSLSLSLSDPIGLINHSFEDFTANPFIPQSIQDAAISLISSDIQAKWPEIKTILYDFVFNCMYYINPLLDSSIGKTSAENQIGEILKSASLLHSNSSFITPSSLTSFVQNIIQINEEYSNSAGLLLLALSRGKAKKYSDSQWIERHFTEYRNAMLSYYQDNPISGSAGSAVRPSITIGGISLRSIPRGVLVMGKDDNLDNLGKTIDLLLPHPMKIDPYYLSETEVTNSQFQSFILSVPRWRPSNREALVKDELVTEEYLSDWTDDRFPAGKADLPVTSISYEAARAFCEWFSGKTRSALPGFSARLPSEAEWEWAARGGLRGMPYPLGEKPGNAVFFSKGIPGPAEAGASDPNGYGLHDMMGNVWEWCADSFGSADYLLTSLDPEVNAELESRHPESLDKVVRGGAWNSQKESIKVFTRGSQRKQWCTPFLGFRVAVAAP